MIVCKAALKLDIVHALSEKRYKSCCCYGILSKCAHLWIFIPKLCILVPLEVYI